MLLRWVREEIEKSINEGEYGEAEDSLRDAFEDEELIEMFKEQSRKDDKLRQAGEIAEQYRKKYEKERERRKQLEDVVADIQGSTVSVDVRAISSSSVEQETPEIADQLVKFIELLDSSIDSGIRESDAPSPPEEFDDSDSAKAWLDDISTWLQGSRAAQQLMMNSDNFAEMANDLMSQL